ncbi:hypothetical protein ACS0TY_014175 [Phlomoides rotata]
MEETICVQCGDRGFTNAFVHCVKCLDFAVHRYCLDVIPKTKDEFVRWVCDNCEAKVKSQFPVHKCYYSPSDARFRSKVSKNIEGLTRNGTKENDLVVVKTETDEPVCKDGPEQSYDGLAKLHSVVCAKSANQTTLMQSVKKNNEQNSSSQQPEEEKVKANSQKKTIKKKKKKKQKTRKLNVIACDDQHKLNKASSKKSHEECMEIGTTVCTRSAIDSTLPSKVKENKVSGQRIVSDTDPGSLEHPFVSANGHERSSKKPKIVEVNMLTPENKGLDLGNRCSKLSIEERKVDVGLGCIENAEPEDTEERTSSTLHWSNIRRKNCPNDVDIDVHVPAGPVVMPIWRGCFSILNKKYDNLDEIVAHASSKACVQVYEAASQFEPMLQFEMLPKSEIWPKSFQKSEPSENIALYFFPSKTSEQDFDILVEKMMNEDLGLKAVVQNAELLIFSSTELPLSYWRFQGKYYIWGVFRGKQKPPSQFQSATKMPWRCASGSPPSCSSRV